MLSPTADTFRLVLHVLAATVWVGGQIVLGGIVPSLRRAHPDATKTVARAYNRVAWPAFAVLIATGLWNLLAIDVTETSSAYQATLFAHIGLAAVTGAGAAVHVIGRSKAALAAGGAIGLVGALGALFVGVLLRTGG